MRTREQERIERRERLWQHLAPDVRYIKALEASVTASVAAPVETRRAPAMSQTEQMLADWRQRYLVPPGRFDEARRHDFPRPVRHYRRWWDE